MGQNIDSQCNLAECHPPFPLILKLENTAFILRKKISNKKRMES